MPNRRWRAPITGDGCQPAALSARSVLAGLGDKQDRFSRLARALVERRGYWKAAVAIAAKNLRLAWAVMKYGEDFRLTAGVA